LKRIQVLIKAIFTKPPPHTTGKRESITATYAAVKAKDFENLAADMLEMYEYSTSGGAVSPAEAATILRRFVELVVDESAKLLID
jgi:hypothetical protein